MMMATKRRKMAVMATPMPGNLRCAQTGAKSRVEAARHAQEALRVAAAAALYSVVGHGMVT
jgi:hypothetical protein